MKLIYKILDFFRSNKRKKPIKETKPVLYNPYLSKKDIAAMQKLILNTHKEREIGVHPKYRNRQSQYTEQDVKDWERKEKEWENKNV